MESSLLAVLGVVGVAASVVGLIARRLRVPQVLLYLLLGALAGPSLLNLVNPDDLGEFFTVTLEVLVALIVFEGAFSIDARGLRRTGLVVRNLLTVGVAVTFLLALALGGSVWMLHLAVDVAFLAYVGLLISIQQQSMEKDVKVRYMPQATRQAPQPQLAVRRYGS